MNNVHWPLFFKNCKRENPNLDAAMQTVRDIFAMSFEVLVQLGRTGAYNHFTRHKATIRDMGVDSIKDVAKHTRLVTLNWGWIAGND